MKKRILIAALTAAMASSIFGVTVNAAERELNINWLSSRSASESAILAIQDIAKQYQEENPDLDFNFEIENISDRTAYLQKLKILAASDELPSGLTPIRIPGSQILLQTEKPIPLKICTKSLECMTRFSQSRRNTQDFQMAV